MLIGGVGERLKPPVLAHGVHFTWTGEFWNLAPSATKLNNLASNRGQALETGVCLNWAHSVPGRLLIRPLTAQWCSFSFGLGQAPMVKRAASFKSSSLTML